MSNSFSELLKGIFKKNTHAPPKDYFIFFIALTAVAVIRSYLWSGLFDRLIKASSGDTFFTISTLACWTIVALATAAISSRLLSLVLVPAALIICFANYVGISIYSAIAFQSSFSFLDVILMVVISAIMSRLDILFASLLGLWCWKKMTAEGELV